MSSSANNISTGIDKQALYGDFRDRLKWQDTLYRRAAHKALDIPEDDMLINANKSGIGALGAIGIALASGLPIAALAGAMLLGNKPATPTIPTPEKIIETVTETIGVRAGIPIVEKPVD